MKLNKTQLTQFEFLLKSQGFKWEPSYKGIFSYYKSIIKEDDFRLYVHLEFYDFSKYDQYIPKEFPFSFEPKITIVQKSLSTELEIPFIFNEHPLFSYYDYEKKCFVEVEWNDKKIWKYLDALEDIARTFMIFYNHSVKEYIIE